MAKRVLQKVIFLIQLETLEFIQAWLFSVTILILKLVRHLQVFRRTWFCYKFNCQEASLDLHHLGFQVETMGPSGPRASTHVYDGRVFRVDFEGKVFIQSIVTRKPPQQVKKSWLRNQGLIGSLPKGWTCPDWLHFALGENFTCQAKLNLCYVRPNAGLFT